MGISQVGCPFLCQVQCASLPANSAPVGWSIQAHCNFTVLYLKYLKFNGVTFLELHYMAAWDWTTTFCDFWKLDRNMPRTAMMPCYASFSRRRGWAKPDVKAATCEAADCTGGEKRQGPSRCDVLAQSSRFLVQQKFVFARRFFEHPRGPSRKRTASIPPGPLQRATALFQAEPEEDVQKQSSSSSSKRLFEAECEDSDDTGDCDDASVEKPNVKATSFNFGWMQLHLAAKARFTEDVSTAGKPTKISRPYDNTKRKAMASFKRTGHKLRDNGKSAKRIASVLSKDSCLCTFLVKIFCFLLFLNIWVHSCALTSKSFYMLCSNFITWFKYIYTWG